MRIFINNVDGYVGQALCADLRSALGQENRLLGTVGAGGTAELAEALGVKRVVSRDDYQKYLADVLSCSLIVYDLHSADIEEVESVIKSLKIAPLDHDITFVLVSSVSVWARTRPEYVPLEGEDDEEPPQEEEEGGVPREVKKRPKELSDADLDRRIPAAAFESWKYLETMALSLCSKERLRPHVVAAGVLYGNGETTFNELFKAAWLTQPIHNIITPGDNYIPCVHVRDVARLVKTVHVRDPNAAAVGRYLIAVDRARLTQAEIVRGIVDQISKPGTAIPVVEAAQAITPFKDVMTLDLIMEASAPMSSPSFPWWCRNGLVANIEKVASEFCTWRNLRPIKMVLFGPPGAGTECLSAMVAERYLHENPPLLTFDGILQEAMAASTPAAGRLRTKVQRLGSVPGKKLPLRLRTKLVRKKLLSNVCRYRGYVLEGYPSSVEEAQALFTELPLTEEEAAEAAAAEAAEEEAEGEEEEGEEEQEPPAPDPDAEEEEEDGAAQRVVSSAVAPQFVVAVRSSPEACKSRIFLGNAAGPSSEEAFVAQTAEFNAANHTLDGSPGTSDFFEETVGQKVLALDLDSIGTAEAFQAVQVYMESNGQFFNYLRSEEDMCKEKQRTLWLDEEQERLALEEQRASQDALEAALREKTAQEEAGREQVLAENAADHLETETAPLRQYLMVNVVPTLTNGLSEVCKEQPEDPIEYLAQYLFAHAQDIDMEAAATI